MPSKWALDEAQAINDAWIREGTLAPPDTTIAVAIDAAYQAGERRGRERAADVAGAERGRCVSRDCTCGHIERAIRGLPDEPPEVR